jgi:formylmethanofuran dehydrogenase subunit A
MGATGDMGLFGRAGRLKVALCDPEDCQGHIRLMLGFSRPLCIGKGDRFNTRIANRALRLALRHPRRLAFSTDMPNHGGLESYPHLFGDLINQRAGRWDGETEASARQFTLQDFVRVTRQIPAEILNLSDKGHLGIGGVADIALYDLKDESMDLSARLGSCAYLVKRGKVVVEEFMMAGEDVDKRTYYSGTEGEGDALAQEICRSSSLRFENLRVGEEMTGKTVYAKP